MKKGECTEVIIQFVYAPRVIVYRSSGNATPASNLPVYKGVEGKILRGRGMISNS